MSKNATSNALANAPGITPSNAIGNSWSNSPRYAWAYGNQNIHRLRFAQPMCARKDMVLE